MTRSHFVGFGCALFAAMLATALPVAAGEAWDSIRDEVYGNRHMRDGSAVIKLDAPYRPEDLMQVRLHANITLGKGQIIKTIAFVVDNNPSPVAARFTLGQKRRHANFATNIRLNEASDVHVVVETESGELYVVEQHVKFAGGQSSCSAPPAGDPKEIIANMGKMKLKLLSTPATGTNQTQRVAYELNHPNHTGMVLDQLTLLYVPLMMVSKIEAWQGSDLVFEMDGSITMSQNPSVEFDFLTNGAETLTFTAKDTDGKTWTKTLPIGAGS
ncbi:MAG: quinoprotein dehydrogenase-associated SoxYZ-like carrier [Alphaproteobacteria bacterium]|nr:quinoprotein dehydrogenase-associated SoxYZ-like carrier [Alphaproteobacteria bacterium]